MFPIIFFISLFSFIIFMATWQILGSFYVAIWLVVGIWLFTLLVTVLIRRLTVMSENKKGVLILREFCKKTIHAFWNV